MLAAFSPAGCWLPSSCPTNVWARGVVGCPHLSLEGTSLPAASSAPSQLTLRLGRMSSTPAGTEPGQLYPSPHSVLLIQPTRQTSILPPFLPSFIPYRQPAIYPSIPPFLSLYIPLFCFISVLSLPPPSSLLAVCTPLFHLLLLLSSTILSLCCCQG